MAEMLEEEEFFQMRYVQRPLYDNSARNVTFSPIRVKAWYLNQRSTKNARHGRDPPSHPMATAATSSSPITARRAKAKTPSRSNGWEADLDSQSDKLPSWLSHSVLMDVKDLSLCWRPSWQRGPLLLSNRIETASAASGGRDSSVSSGWEDKGVSKQGGSYSSNGEDDKIVQPSTGRTESVSEFSTKAPLPIMADDVTLLTNDGCEVLPPSNLGSWAGWSNNKIRIAASTSDESSRGPDASPCGSDSSSGVDETDEEDGEGLVYSSSSNEDGDIIQLEAGVREKKVGCNGDICYTAEEEQVIRRVLSRQLSNGVPADNQCASKLASFTLHDWRQKLCGPIIRELETSKSYRPSGLDANYRFGREESVPPLKRFINNQLAFDPPALLSETLPANIRRRAFVNTANAMRGTTKDSFFTVHGSGSELTPRNVDSASERDVSGMYGANLVPNSARFDPSTRKSSAVIKDRMLQNNRGLRYNAANLGTVAYGSGNGDEVSSTDTRRHGREPKTSNQTGTTNEANAGRVPRAIVKDNGEENQFLVPSAAAKNTLHGVGERSKRATSNTLYEQSESILEYYTTRHVIPESVGPAPACSIASDSYGDSDAQSEAESDAGEPPVVLPLSRPGNTATLEGRHVAERKINTSAAGKQTISRRRGGVGERFGGYKRVGDAIRGGSYWRRAAQVHSTAAAQLSSANFLSACPCIRKESSQNSLTFAAGSAGRVEESGGTGAGSSHRCQTIAEPKRQETTNRFVATNAAPIPRYTVIRRNGDHGSVKRQTATSASRFPSTISRKPSLRLEAAASSTVWATDKRSVDVKPENTPEVSLPGASRQGALRHGSSLLPSHTRARYIENEVNNRDTLVLREPGERSHDPSARERSIEEQGFHHRRRGVPNGVHNDAASSNRTGHALYEYAKKMGGVANLQITPFPVDGSHRRITCGLLW